MASNKLYIVIDAQNDFITGSLGSEWANTTTDDIAKFLDTVIDDPSTYDIWATQDTHYDENMVIPYTDKAYFQTLEGKKLPVLHCVKGTKGWELDERILPYIDANHIVEKPTFMGYDFGTIIAEELRRASMNHGKIIDEIVLFGFYTSISVVSNALFLRGILPDKKISVIANLCADINEESHKAALAVMQNCQIDINGVIIEDVEENP